MVKCRKKAPNNEFVKASDIHIQHTHSACFIQSPKCSSKGKGKCKNKRSKHQKMCLLPMPRSIMHHTPPYIQTFQRTERAIFFLRSFDARSCWYFYIYAFALSFWRCVKMKRKNNNNTYLRSFITAISVFNLPHYLRLTFIVFIVVAISSRRRRQQRRQQQQQPE